MIGPSKIPDVDLDVPVASLAAGTRREEARAAMALVAALVDCGISPSDVTVVVRDIDPYEEPLTRAARRYGVTPTFWTQLRLKRTLLYQLTVATIGALDVAIRQKNSRRLATRSSRSRPVLAFVEALRR